MRTGDDSTHSPFGLLHTDAWIAIADHLKRLLLRLQSAATAAERKSLKQHFADQLLEQIREFRASSPTNIPLSTSPTSSSAHAQLNSLAFLAVATFFDKHIVNDDCDDLVTGGVYEQVCTVTAARTPTARMLPHLCVPMVGGSASFVPLVHEWLWKSYTFIHDLA